MSPNVARRYRSCTNTALFSDFTGDFLGATIYVSELLAAPNIEAYFQQPEHI